MSKEQPIDFSPLTDVNAVNAMIKLLKGDKFHLLPASIPDRVARIPDQHQICFSPKLFDPDPKGPDVYHDNRMPGQQVGLKHTALVELWNAAGGSPVASMRIDDGNDPNYVEWQYSGKYREIGGMWIPSVQSKRLDFRGESAQIKSMTDGQLSQQRSSIYELAESKAFSRVIRKALGVKQSYTPDEIAWPFVVVRPMLVANLKDPLTRAIFLADAMGSSAALFGNADFMKQLMMPSAPEEEYPAQVTGASGGQKAIAAPLAHPLADAKEAPKLSKENTIRESAKDFDAADEPAQVAILTSMARTKGYGPLPEMYDPKKPKHRRSFFDKLIQMPDKEEWEDPFL